MRERNEMGVKDRRGPDDGVLKIIADDEKAPAPKNQRPRPELPPARSPSLRQPA